MKLISYCFVTILIVNGNILFARTSMGDTSQPPCIQKAYQLLDESLSLMQEHYYKKDSVQWDTLIIAAKSRLNNLSGCDDAYEAVKWCFQQIKERHSFIMPPVKAALYNGNINSSGSPASMEKMAGPIRSELVENDIAYIDVPWISTADQNMCTALADSLQQIIAGFDKKGVRKWIVDLRRNTGGNCWPMLAGLAPLLGNGVYGYFVSSSEKIPFSYRDGTMYQGKYARCVVSNAYTMASSDRAIIVLTGASTASAGEIVALAFKGINKVYLYGEPTAGLTTANGTYKLSDGSLLVLTVCKEADRTGKVIDGKIRPDEIIIPSSNGGKDAVKTAALMFLQME